MFWPIISTNVIRGIPEFQHFFFLQIKIDQRKYSEFVTVGYQFSAALEILRVSFEVRTVDLLVWILRFALNVFGVLIVIFAYFSLGRVRSTLKSWILLCSHLKLRTSLNSAGAISLLHYVTESLSTNCFGNYFLQILLLCRCLIMIRVNENWTTMKTTLYITLVKLWSLI